MRTLSEFWFGTAEAAPTETRAEEPPAEDGLTVPARDSSGAVTSGEALGLIAVYRAISIQVIAVKQLSLDVERGGKRIDRPAIIRRPSLDCSLGAFLEQTVMSRELAGNAYWLIVRDSAGAVRELEVLNPHDVTIRTNAAGRVVGYTYRGRDLKRDEVRHLPKRRVPGTPYGLGPIQAARTELRGAIDTRDYASGWFADSGLPAGGYWTTDKPLAPGQAAKTRAELKKATADRGGAPVVDSGLELRPFGLSPEDAQWLQAQQWNTTSIARLFGVPLTLMAAVLDGNSMTYSNVTQEWLAYVRFTLADDLIEIEEAFTDVLPPAHRARFAVEALLRSDIAGRYAAHESAIRAGWMTPNEVRGIENLASITGGDTLAAPKTTKETPA